MVAVLAMFLVFDAGPAGAHTGPAVIVDTDMAADDARALALLLASPHFRVVAVVTSDGASPPDIGATNVCRVLQFLRKDGVAVGLGRALAAPPPAFRTNATGLDWGQLGDPLIPPGGLGYATNVIRVALRTTPHGVIYICLGPLTNLADALEGAPELASAISSVLWYGTAPNAPQPDWNAMRDATA